MSRLVVALGGNALLRRGQPLEAKIQRANCGKPLIGSLAELTEVAAGRSGTRIELLALRVSK